MPKKPAVARREVVGSDLIQKMSHHLKQMQDLFDENREAIEVEILKGTAADMARFFVYLRELKDRMEDLQKTTGSQYTRWKENVIPERFELEGITSLPLVDVGRVGVSINTRASIKAGEQEAAFAWLRKNELDIIRETVNASTLSSTAKSIMEEGRELPEDHFNVMLVPNTSFTRAANKSK